jgi:hypothetical protein
MKPLVSVIVPTLNRPHLLRRALTSIAAQDYRPLEAAVVNDGGEDVKEVLAEFAGRLDIAYRQHAERRGLPAARNTGIRATTGHFIAYLDDDDALLPGHVSTLVSHLQQQAADCAYANFAFVFEDRAHDCREIARQERITDAIPLERIAVECITAVCSVVHRRRCLDRVGMFDETLTIGMEDWDLWMRLFPAVQTIHVAQVTSLVYQDVAVENMSTVDFAKSAQLTQTLYERHQRLVEGRPDLQRERQRVYHIRRLLGELIEAMARMSGGVPRVSLTSEELLRARGFGRQVHDLVVELADALVLTEEQKRQLEAPARAGPIGRKRLLGMLVRECLANPLPGWLRRRLAPRRKAPR